MVPFSHPGLWPTSRYRESKSASSKLFSPACLDDFIHQTIRLARTRHVLIGQGRRGRPDASVEPVIPTVGGLAVVFIGVMAAWTVPHISPVAGVVLAQLAQQI